MARALVIEEESGTYTGRRHPHNGYYAGDFSAPRVPSSRPRSPRRRGTCTSFPGSRHVVAPTGARVSDRPSDLPRAADPPRATVGPLQMPNRARPTYCDRRRR